MYSGKGILSRKKGICENNPFSYSHTRNLSLLLSMQKLLISMNVTLTTIGIKQNSCKNYYLVLITLSVFSVLCLVLGSSSKLVSK